MIASHEMHIIPIDIYGCTGMGLLIFHMF